MAAKRKKLCNYSIPEFLQLDTSNIALSAKDADDALRMAIEAKTLTDAITKQVINHRNGIHYVIAIKWLSKNTYKNFEAMNKAHGICSNHYHDAMAAEIKASDLMETLTNLTEHLLTQEGRENEIPEAMSKIQNA